MRAISDIYFIKNVIVNKWQRLINQANQES